MDRYTPKLGMTVVNLAYRKWTNHQPMKKAHLVFGQPEGHFVTQRRNLNTNDQNASHSMASPSPSPPLKEPSNTNTDSRLIFLRGLISLDTSLSRSLHTLFHPFLPGPLLLLLEYSADFRLSFPVCLSLLFVPWSSALRFPFLLPLIVGLLVDLALIGLIKSVFRRSRPHYNPNMSAVVSVDHFSFPSGHASRVFYLAAFLSLSAGTIRETLTNFRPPGGVFGQWIGEDEGKFVASAVLCIWVWAAATSVSRILLGRHFVLDVLAGAFVGVLEGIFVFRFVAMNDSVSKLWKQFFTF